MAVAVPVISAAIAAGATYYATTEAKKRSQEAIKAAKPPKVAPKVDNLAAERLRRQRLAGRNARSSTILTSPLGAAGGNTTGAPRATLLGN